MLYEQLMFLDISQGMLIQYGLKMTCEMTSNLKSLLSKSYVTIDNLFATKKKYDRSLECIRKVQSSLIYYYYYQSFIVL